MIASDTGLPVFLLVRRMASVTSSPFFISGLTGSKV
jgi:hypothetical protein